MEMYAEIHSQSLSTVEERKEDYIYSEGKDHDRELQIERWPELMGAHGH